MQALHNALLFGIRAIRARPGQAVRLVVVLAVAVAAWTALTALASPFVQPRVTADVGGVLVHSASQGTQLPVKYAARIEAMPGARHVAYTNAIVVSCKDASDPVSINGFGGPGARVQALGLAGQSSQADKQASAWMADPLGVLIGTQVASACGWREGMGVAPRNVFTGKPIELHVIGIRPPQKNPMADQIVLAHYDYINKVAPTITGHDKVGSIVVVGADPHAAPRLAAQIEEAFSHDNPPVEALTMSEFQNGLARFGQAQYVLGAVTVAVFLCAALVLTSVLAHAVAQRRPQMALLQVLGFSRITLWAGFALEALAIALVGAALGAAAGMLALRLLPREMTNMSSGLAVPAWTWWGLAIWLVVLLAAALAIPSLAVARLRPVDVRTL